MTTYTKAGMITEIESILKRTDLTTKVGEAIDRAIRYYQNEQLYFNETKTAQFNCVVGQVYYNGDDDADIPLMNKFDALHVRISNNDRPLERMKDVNAFEQLVDGNVSNGEPSTFIFYANALGLYPPPNSTYTVTMFGGYDAAAPATDAEADNVWMTDAYDLIMYRALYYLNVYHTRDYTFGSANKEDSKDELDNLYKRTNRLKGSNRIKPTSF